MNRTTRVRTPLTVGFIAALVTLLTSCGGGGGSSTSAGIDRLGVNSGTVTGFGSIFVDGVRYATDDATFDIDDDDIGATQDNLRVGDVVAVLFSTAAPNVALIVVADEIVEGPVESVDIAAGTLVVARQTVTIDANTRFDDDIPTGSLNGISVGDTLEISGFLESDGMILATLIDDEDDDDLEVHGFISDLDSVNFTFRLNDLIVDYSSAVLDDDFANGELANGVRVEVKGDNYDGTTLVADEIDPDGIGFGADGEDLLEGIDDAEIEGLISNFVAPGQFEVNGIEVRTTAATQYDDGTVNDLADGVAVEVEGFFNDDGVLIALEIGFEDDDDNDVDDAEIEGTISNFVAPGQFEVSGIEIRATESTRYDDGTVNDLADGVAVEVEGFFNDDGVLIAREIGFEDDDDDDDD